MIFRPYEKFLFINKIKLSVNIDNFCIDFTNNDSSFIEIYSVR